MGLWLEVVFVGHKPAQGRHAQVWLQMRVEDIQVHRYTDVKLGFSKAEVRRQKMVEFVGEVWSDNNNARTIEGNRQSSHVEAAPNFREEPFRIPVAGCHVITFKRLCMSLQSDCGTPSICA